jgi:hypothetical protein
MPPPWRPVRVAIAPVHPLLGKRIPMTITSIEIRRAASLFLPVSGVLALAV